MVASVEELLNSKNISYRSSGKDLVLNCLNPEHDDTNPSFRINKATGIGHCFSCGFKVNIFRFYGITGFISSVAIAKLKEKINELAINDSVSAVFNGNMIPYTREFRGVSSETLKKFEAFHTDEVDMMDRIIFPIYNLSGIIKAYIGRHMLSDGNPRYKITPSKAKIPIFPESHPADKSYLILVEGIFDMLNLYDKGCTRVSTTFGTDTLTQNTETKLLPFKSIGVTKIYLLFDGDAAGAKAAAKIKPLIEECGFDVEIIELEEDTDPGDMTKEQVQQLLEYIEND